MDLSIAAKQLKLLADETRLRVLHILAIAGEKNVTDMCDEMSVSQPALSHHLALLRVGGIVEARRDGKNNFYSISRTGRVILTQLGALLMLKGSTRQES